MDGECVVGPRAGSRRSRPVARGAGGRGRGRGSVGVYSTHDSTVRSVAVARESSSRSTVRPRGRDTRPDSTPSSEISNQNKYRQSYRISIFLRI